MWIKVIAILLAGLFLSVVLAKCNQTPNADTTACVDQWAAAHRKEVGDEPIITMDQIREWKEWCVVGKTPPSN
jgi:hypothetical protein